jgi:hypothetical protein
MEFRQLNTRLATIGLALTLLLTGCEFWNSGGTTFVAPKDAFTLPVPAGWSYTTAMRTPFTATRDGLAIQTIVVRVDRLDRALGNSDREIPADLNAFELAEWVVDDLRADKDHGGLTVLSNEPFDFGGEPGYKLTVTFTLPDGLAMTQTRCGAIRDGQLWTLTFTAPRRHYHARDLGAFEALAAGFRFGPVPASATTRGS